MYYQNQRNLGNLPSKQFHLHLSRRRTNLKGPNAATATVNVCAGVGEGLAVELIATDVAKVWGPAVA